MNVLDTMDAVKWAEAFVQIRNKVQEEGKKDIADDEETMVAWFANAIMKGYDEGHEAGMLQAEKDANSTAYNRGFEHGIQVGYAELDLHREYERRKVQEEYANKEKNQTVIGSNAFDKAMSIV